jgi:Na+/citrate or Na+/malate symporter
MLKDIYFFVSYDVMLDYIYTKKGSHNIWKNENIFKISLKWFLIYIFIVFIKHYDSIWLEYFVSHVKSLIIIILWMSF